MIISKKEAKFKKKTFQENLKKNFFPLCIKCIRLKKKHFAKKNDV